MDEAQQYTCPECDYNCRIGESDEHDAHNCRMAVRVCLDCRHVIEVLLAEYKLRTRPNAAAPLGFEPVAFYWHPNKPICLRCNTVNQHPWDRERRPCPRCATPMNLTELKVFFHAPDPPIVMELGEKHPGF